MCSIPLLGTSLAVRTRARYHQSLQNDVVDLNTGRLFNPWDTQMVSEKKIASKDEFIVVYMVLKKQS